MCVCVFVGGGGGGVLGAQAADTKLTKALRNLILHKFCLEY